VTHRAQRDLVDTVDPPPEARRGGSWDEDYHLEGGGRMKYMRLHVRGISILGAIITVLLLFSVSCGSGSTTTADVRKSVSTNYYLSGWVWYDENNNYTWDEGEFGVPDIHVIFVNYGANPPTEYEDWTDSVGTYLITVPSGAYGRLGPTEYGEGYNHYDPSGYELSIDKSYFGKNFRGYYEEEQSAEERDLGKTAVRIAGSCRRQYAVERPRTARACFREA
jgi:hypothetical protein